MNLYFNRELQTGYKSNSQIARVLTEDWVLNNSYSPSCGNLKLEKYGNNNPASDFYCNKCNSNFELKSSKSPLTNKVVDGAFNTMIQKIKSSENPHFLFLNYSREFKVINFFVIPKYYFIPEIIERRKPFNINARRAGWIGCNILLKNLPNSGIIFLVKNETIADPIFVNEQWGKTVFLKNEKLNNRGWLLELISIIDLIPNKRFSLIDIYKYEKYFKEKFPKNNFIKEKLRQQLQVLRDAGFIKFIDKGIYERS